MGLHLLVAMVTALLVAQAHAAPGTRTVLIVGDSLSAEYGIAAGTGWVTGLGRKVSGMRPAVKVVNSSISGETTVGGRTRLGALLREHKPQVVVIELGANDALRGLPLSATEDNLADMVKACRSTGAKVLLVGMQLPPNYGKRYSEAFAAVFVRVAQTHQVALTPFLLKGVADRPDARDWFQPDGLHPLAKAHPIMLDNVWQKLAPLLK